MTERTARTPFQRRTVLVGAELSYRVAVIHNRIGSKVKAAAEIGVAESTFEEALVPYGRMLASTHERFLAQLKEAEDRLDAREAS